MTTNYNSLFILVKNRLKVGVKMNYYEEIKNELINNEITKKVKY